MDEKNHKLGWARAGATAHGRPGATALAHSLSSAAASAGGGDN